jgi:hypothetical protein
MRKTTSTPVPDWTWTPDGQVARVSHPSWVSNRDLCRFFTSSSLAHYNPSPEQPQAFTGALAREMLAPDRGVNPMRTLAETLLLSGTLLFLPERARPADDNAAAVATTAPEPAAQPGAAAPEAASPSSPPPAEAPPAPPSQTPPAPPAQAQAPAAQPVPPGQWVYTSQYGWVWMPYGDAYTYAPPDGYGVPYMYLYYPAYGWTWLVAPWVWGWGPWPYFGAYGPWGFGWYGHGWWRYPGRWHSAPYPFGGGYGHRGIRPAPPRGGFGYGANLGVRGGFGGHGVSSGQAGGGGRAGGRHR